MARGPGATAARAAASVILVTLSVRVDPRAERMAFDSALEVAPG